MSNVNIYPNNIEEILKNDFPHLKNTTYLDYAGSGVYAKQLINNHFKDLQENLYGNPHSKNPSSSLTDENISQVRETVLEYFNVSSEDYTCIFTSGATHALSLLAHAFPWKNGSTFAYLDDNHTSVVGMRQVAMNFNKVSVFCIENKAKSHHENLHITKLNNYEAIQIRGATVQIDEPNKLNEDIFSLFAYPAQSNFNGQKYPLNWINEVHKNGFKNPLNTLDSSKLNPDKSETNRWLVVLDAASFVTSSKLDLVKYPADFIVISFYKMFGFPTGLGALIVKNSVGKYLLKNSYFGGGSASGWLATEDYYLPRKSLNEKFEDGTLPFLNIIALQHAFNFMKNINIDSALKIQSHTFSLIKFIYNKMINMKHSNNQRLVVIYSNNLYESSDQQGPIISFNLMKADGSPFGSNYVSSLAALKNIHLRSGCFCNIGACCRYLEIPIETLKMSYETGNHICGDNIDIINHKPVGCVRLSLGYTSTMADMLTFLNFLKDSFLDSELDKTIPPENNFTKNHNLDIKLEKIILYPVKSCRGMEVESWEINETGLKYDRYWMIVNEKYVYLSLKKNKANKLALLQPHVDKVTGDLTISYKGENLPTDTNSSINCQYITNYDLLDTKLFVLFGQTVSAVNCGVNISKWLTKILGIKCYLFQIKDTKARSLKKQSCIPRFNDQAMNVSLVNLSQYLMISRESVFHLSTLIKNTGNLTERFRANFIVSGAPAYAENEWKEIEIVNNGVVFKKCGDCFRCSMIGVHPETGTRNNELLQTLFKAGRKSFGIYLQSQTTSFTIKTGSVLKCSF